MSLDDLAAAVPMDKGNLSKVERGLLPYNQEMLESLSKALDTPTWDLLARAPGQPQKIWQTYDSAKPAEKRLIEAAAEAIVKTGTS